MVQSPQMIQAMQVLQLPTVELADRIDKELLENPFLEVKENGPPKDQDTSLDAQTAQASSSPMETLDQWEAGASELRAPQRFQRVARDATDRAYEALQNTPNREKSLSQALISQLHLLDLSEKEVALGEYIIYSLDDRGYLTESPEMIAQSVGEEVSPEEVAKIIHTLQELGPPGLAARNLKECLLLQIDSLPGDHDLLRLVVENHLEDLQANRLPKIAKDLGRSISEIKIALEMIRKLDPKPGSRSGGEPTAVINPDVVVEEIDGNYEVRLERGSLPELQISSSYREMLTRVKADPKVFEFLKKRIEAAKWFMDAVYQRQFTIEKICRAIVRRQKDFLDKGIDALHPLKMQEIADEVGVHISTVSRAISGKYVQTPRGIFELKFFFTGGTRTESGEVASQTSIKEKIVEIIAAENRRQPLSDEEIAKKLKDQDGLPIARRTITKYRKTLDIPPSHLRRQF